MEIALCFDWSLRDSIRNVWEVVIRLMNCIITTKLEKGKNVKKIIMCDNSVLTMIVSHVLKDAFKPLRKGKECKKHITFDYSYLTMVFPLWCNTHSNHKARKKKECRENITFDNSALTVIVPLWWKTPSNHKTRQRKECKNI